MNFVIQQTGKPMSISGGAKYTHGLLNLTAPGLPRAARHTPIAGPRQRMDLRLLCGIVMEV
jgi:hypothetical protein